MDGNPPTATVFIDLSKESDLIRVSLVQLYLNWSSQLFSMLVLMKFSFSFSLDWFFTLKDVLTLQSVVEIPELAQIQGSI